MPVSININANWHNESNLVASERVSAFKETNQVSLLISYPNQHKTKLLKSVILLKIQQLKPTLISYHRIFDTPLNRYKGIKWK